MNVSVQYGGKFHTSLNTYSFGAKENVKIYHIIKNRKKGDLFMLVILL